MRPALAIVGIAAVLTAATAMRAADSGGVSSGGSTAATATAAHDSRAAAPATQPTASDGWVGEYHRLDYLHERNGESSRLTVVRVGDHYQLRGGSYDSYEFIEDKPGLLWDRKHILGSISRGKLTYEAAGRTGPLPAETVLNVQFCYEFFLLIADPPHPPAGAPAAAAGAGPETGGADAENILLWKRLGIAAIEKFLDDPAHNEIAAAARGRLHSLEHIELVDRNETAQAIRHLQDFSPLQKAGPSFDPKDVDPKTVVVVYLNGPAGGSWRIGVVFDKTTATTKAVVYVPGK